MFTSYDQCILCERRKNFSKPLFTNILEPNLIHTVQLMLKKMFTKYNVGHHNPLSFYRNKFSQNFHHFEIAVQSLSSKNGFFF